MGSQHLNVRDLAVKFDAYAHYIASREWARESLSLPLLVCVAHDIDQERRLQRVARARLLRSPGLGLWTTTEELLNRYGPLTLVYLPVLPTSRQVTRVGASPRQGVFGVAVL